MNTTEKIALLKQEKTKTRSKLIDVPKKFLRSGIQKAYIFELEGIMLGSHYKIPCLIEISGCELIDGQYRNCKITKNGVELDDKLKPKGIPNGGVWAMWDKTGKPSSSYPEANRVWALMKKMKLISEEWL